jgi:hypothetical protein
MDGKGTEIVRYSQDELEAWHKVATSIAPWVKDKNGNVTMSSQQVGFVLRNILNMGLDPLNKNEVHVFQDKDGKINIQIAYQITTEWLRKIHGDFTEPIYSRLDADALMDEGLPPDTVAYRCRFMMKYDWERLNEAAQIFGADVARQMFEITGLGTSDAKEFNAWYFSPKGRSPAWKVRKRAFVDAITRKFGTPSAPELDAIRRTPIANPFALEKAIETAPGASVDDIRALAQSVDRPALTSDDAQDALAALFPGRAKARVPESHTPRCRQPGMNEEIEKLKAQASGDVIDGDFEEQSGPSAEDDCIGDADSAPPAVPSGVSSAVWSRFCEAGLTLPAVGSYVAPGDVEKVMKIALRGITEKGRAPAKAQAYIESEIAALNAEAAARTDSVPDGIFDDEADGELFLDVVEVRPVTVNGKTRQALDSDHPQSAGSNYPESILWFKGRDALLEAAPWLAESATRDQLGTVGERFPFEARVYYEINQKGFKDITHIERMS